MNKQIVNKYFCSHGQQAALKAGLIRSLFDCASFDHTVPLAIWKLQARKNGDSVSTVILYKSGTVVCMGHGELFDLTTRVVSSYDTPIGPKKDFGSLPKAGSKTRNLTERTRGQKHGRK